MTASGRKRTLISAVFQQSERPLSGKADIGSKVFGQVDSGVETDLACRGYLIHDFLLAGEQDEIYLNCVVRPQ